MFFFINKLTWSSRWFVSRNHLGRLGWKQLGKGQVLSNYTWQLIGWNHLSITACHTCKSQSGEKRQLLDSSDTTDAIAASMLTSLRTSSCCRQTNDTDTPSGDTDLFDFLWLGPDAVYKNGSRPLVLKVKPLPRCLKPVFSRMTSRGWLYKTKLKNDCTCHLIYKVTKHFTKGFMVLMSVFFKTAWCSFCDLWSHLDPNRRLGRGYGVIDS